MALGGSSSGAFIETLLSNTWPWFVSGTRPLPWEDMGLGEVWPFGVEDSLWTRLVIRLEDFRSLGTSISWCALLSSTSVSTH